MKLLTSGDRCGDRSQGGRRGSFTGEGSYSILGFLTRGLMLRSSARILPILDCLEGLVTGGGLAIFSNEGICSSKLEGGVGVSGIDLIFHLVKLF